MISNDYRRFSTLFIRLAAFVVIGLLLSACSGGSGAQNSANAGKTYEVAPEFREFYNSLGGENVLGPAISKLFTFQTFECQYTVNVLMCQNPVLTGSSRFGLYPLGHSLNIQESPDTSAPAEGSRVVNGYRIYEEFIPLYDQFSGQQYAGNPISQVHINYSQERIEQYFENIGLYRSFNDAPGEVKLLAYGALACDAECQYSPSIDSLIISSENAGNNQPFLPQLGKIGGATAFGAPLTQPYIASDGAQEQIYTNAVLYSPNGRNGEVKLRPLAVLLGVLTTPPGPQIYGNQDGVVFYAVQGELGYHVPLIFDEFISTHGGLEISGDPVAETIEVQPGLYRQCFENYCLDYQPSAAAGQQVSLAPLGRQYLENMQGANSGEKPLVVSSDTILLQASEQYKRLPSTSPQRIDIVVLKKEDQKPLSGFESTLDLRLPDGSHYTSDISATQEDGKASVIIPAMNTIQNGSILTYKVCLKAAAVEPVCTTGNYLIWNFP